MKIKKEMLLFALVFFAGCAGNCIRVAGGYSDYSGEIEYCFDKEQSKTIQAPVLKDNTGQTFFGITEDEIKKIIEKLKDKTTTLSIDNTHILLQMRKLFESKR